MGTTWYTWLEQGRDVRASLDVLESIARALRLTPAERSHLITLGRGEQAPPLSPEPERVSPTVRRLVENIGPRTPACLLGRRWDFLVWNDAYAAVFGDLSRYPHGKRNLLWLVFMDPAWRELLPDWEPTTRRLVARFRAHHGDHLGDPAFEGLVDALNDGSPEFRRLWPRHEVRTSGEGRKTILHPSAGELYFEHAIFLHGERPEQRLLLYSPQPDTDTPAKLDKLLAGRG